MKRSNISVVILDHSLKLKGTVIMPVIGVSRPVNPTSPQD